jgi:DNA-binding NarL/FixJ family response regulator
VTEALHWEATTRGEATSDGAAGRDTERRLAQPLRLLIADDHALFRRGLREVLEEEADMRVVAEASDGGEAVRRARALWPHGLDLVVMDVDMPHQNGTSAARQIVRELPGLPVVMLTVSTLDRDLYDAVRAGAAGFLSKSLAPTAILRALRDYHREGALPMAPTTAAKALTYFQQLTSEHGTPTAPAGVTSAGRRPAFDQPDLDHRGASWDVRPERSLTPREREVLSLVAQGARDREIADRLVLTESTVKSHVQSILRKLGARNRTEAVARLQRGLA